MRIAVLSDIHGNLTALDAVLADIRAAAPDLVLHGGDLADAGSSPVEVVDRIRGLGWRGVLGNTDEMLIRPESLEAFAARSQAPPSLWDAVRAIASATRDVLGPERLAWLRTLPLSIAEPGFALVHARPGDSWRAPAPDAGDAELEGIYGPLDQPIAVFGHTHLPMIRTLPGTPRLLINTGSVGLPYDGDPRASYLLLDGDMPTLRRVDYDLDRELDRLAASALPGALWTTKILRARAPLLP